MNKELEQELHAVAESIYKDGYAEGYKKGKNERLMMCDPYNRGRSEAWECARKIMDLTSDYVKCHEILGDCAPKYALTKYSASEAMQKIKEWEEKQAKKNCMNCGHRNPHYDTFRCNVTGNCIGREKWIPKREDVKQLPYSDYPKPLTVTMELSSANIMVLEEIVGEKVETEEQAVHALKVAMVYAD